MMIISHSFKLMKSFIIHHHHVTMVVQPQAQSLILGPRLCAKEASSSLASATVICLSEPSILPVNPSSR